MKNLKDRVKHPPLEALGNVVAVRMFRRALCGPAPSSLPGDLRLASAHQVGYALPLVRKNRTRHMLKWSALRLLGSSQRKPFSKTKLPRIVPAATRITVDVVLHAWKAGVKPLPGAQGAAEATKDSPDVQVPS